MRPSSYFNCDMRPFSRHCRLPHAHPGAWWGRRNTTQNTTMATCRVMQVGCCQGRMAKEEATINVASAAFTSPSPSCPLGSLKGGELHSGGVVRWLFWAFFLNILGIKPGSRPFELNPKGAWHFDSPIMPKVPKRPYLNQPPPARVVSAAHHDPHPAVRRRLQARLVASFTCHVAIEGALYADARCSGCSGSSGSCSGSSGS